MTTKDNLTIDQMNYLAYNDTLNSFNNSLITANGVVSTSNPFPIQLRDIYGHGVAAAVDPITAALAIIDAPHGEIHAGRMFFIDSYIDLTNSQVYNMLFIAPSSTKEAHLTWNISFEVEGEFLMYEDPTIASNGTPVTIFNRKRASTTTSLSAIYTSPSVTDVGTLLIKKRVGSGKAFGGEDRSQVELVLCCGKKYLIRVTNGTTSNNLFNYQADWYEVNEFS